MPVHRRRGEHPWLWQRGSLPPLLCHARILLAHVLENETVALYGHHSIAPSAVAAAVAVPGIAADAAGPREAVVGVGIGIEPGAIAPTGWDTGKIVQRHPVGPFFVTQHVIPG